MFELKGGPEPVVHEREWMETVPGSGWFLYFSLRGSDDSRKPGDDRTD